MITRLSHVTVYVLDQEEALAFYTEKLGFEIREDMTLDGFRWLTVGLPSQPDVDLALVKPGPPMFDPETAAQLEALIAKGVLGPGVMATDDCRRDSAHLEDAGVEFLQTPDEQPYGIEAVFRDNSGNWYSLTQPSS